MPPGRVIWTVNGVDRSNRPTCSDAHMEPKREKNIQIIEGNNFVHAQTRFILTDSPLHLRVGWGRRGNQLCKIFWKSIKGVRSYSRPEKWHFPSAHGSDLSRRSLRSAGRGDLFVSRANTSIGQRSFSIAAPVVWNALPPDLCSPHNSRQQFRSKLKTYTSL